MCKRVLIQYNCGHLTPKNPQSKHGVVKCQRVAAQPAVQDCGVVQDKIFQKTGTNNRTRKICASCAKQHTKIRSRARCENAAAATRAPLQDVTNSAKRPWMQVATKEKPARSGSPVDIFVDAENQDDSENIAPKNLK